MNCKSAPQRASSTDATSTRRSLALSSAPWLLGAVLLSACGSGGSNPAKAANIDPGDTGGSGDTSPATGGGDSAVGTGGSATTSTGGSGTSTGSAGMGSGGKGANGAVVQPVICQGEAQRPATAPTLTPGVWVDITPPGVTKYDQQQLIGQGLTLDPCNPWVLYWGNTPFDGSYGGLFRSVDGGANWVKMGDSTLDTNRWDKKTTFLDEVLRVRIDPADNQHMYAGDGVRGITTGFWITHDGGNNWVMPDAWPTDHCGQDIYDVAVDPTDFNHALVTFHAWWPGKQDSGVVETKDGGATWIVHDPGSWGTGHSIKFLYFPEKNIGSPDTWLLGTQGSGYWRTEDAGKTWAKVSDVGIAHGGGSAYLTANGYVFASGYPHNLRSKDVGKTWEEMNADGAYSSVFGDGNLLYTGKLNVDPGESIMVSSEMDGKTWTAFNDQLFRDGPYEMALDKKNGILYSSNWMSGVFALKLK